MFFRRTTLKQAIERTRNETHKRRSGPCASRSRLMVAPVRFRGLKRKQRARALAQYQPLALTQPPVLSSRPRVCMTIHYGFTPLNLTSTKMHPSFVYSFRRYRFFHPVTPRRPFFSIARPPCELSSRSAEGNSTLSHSISTQRILPVPRITCSSIHLRLF